MSDAPSDDESDGEADADGARSNDEDADVAELVALSRRGRQPGDKKTRAVRNKEKRKRALDHSIEERRSAKRINNAAAEAKTTAKQVARDAAAAEARRLLALQVRRAVSRPVFYMPVL